MKLRRIIYYFILLISLVIISFYGGAVSYGFFFTVAMIPFISYAYLFAEFFFFKIYQKLDGRNMVCGSSKDYYFILKNESFMTFSSISIRLFSSFSEIEELPEDTEFCLVKGEQFRYDTRLFCKYRGEYEVGIKEIILTDFFRLFQLKYKMPGTIKALVVPSVADMSSIKGLEEVTTRMSRESMYLNENIDTVVRDYVPGDSMRLINWKLSAKENSLKVRLTYGEEKQGVIILSDTKRYSDNIRDYLPLEDQMLKTLLAISLFFTKKEIPLKVLYEQGSVKINDIHGIDQFDDYYSSVSGLRFDNNNSFDRLLDSVAHNALIHDCAAVICIFHEISKDGINVLNNLASQGKYVISYYVSDENNCNAVTDYTSGINNRSELIYVPLNKGIEEVLS